MPVLGIILLKSLYVMFKKAEEIINKDRPMRGGIMLPIKESEFKSLGVIMLPEEAQYNWILSLPTDITSKELKSQDGETMNSLGEVLNNAMSIIEGKTEQLNSVLYKQYNTISDSILRSLLETFDHEDISNEENKLVEIYYFFVKKFNEYVKGEEGIFFTPPSIVNMIVNILEPSKGIVLDPAIGSGSMLIAVKKYMEKNQYDYHALTTFYGHEKIEYNAKICAMNICINRICGMITGGMEGNTYFKDPFELNGKCDFVLSAPPFNERGICIQSIEQAGRLSFGLPDRTRDQVKNGNFLWISYFYSYLNKTGKAGFVMPTITMNGITDKKIREKIIKTKHIDLLINVAPKYYEGDYKSDCCIWFINKEKSADLEKKILFIESAGYYTAINAGRNHWDKWQQKNLNAIVWLYRGQINKYQELLEIYRKELRNYVNEFGVSVDKEDYFSALKNKRDDFMREINLEIEQCLKNNKKEIINECQKRKNLFQKALKIAKEYEWIYSKFGEGEYKDITGLCKVVDIKEVLDTDDCSLVPGCYVGIEGEDSEDEFTFNEQMERLQKELEKLELEGAEIMKRIRDNKYLWKK